MIRKLALTVALCAALGLSTPASAKDMNGKFGVGLSQSLTSGVTGLGLNYWIGNLKLGTIFGMNFFFPDTDDPKNNNESDVQSTVVIALQALYAIARADDANLNFGLRFNMGIRDPGAADTIFGVQFDIPIEGEYFLSEHFSLYGHVGITLTIIGEDGNPLAAGNQGFNLGIGDGGFSGGAGFNFYF